MMKKLWISAITSLVVSTAYSQSVPNSILEFMDLYDCESEYEIKGQDTIVYLKTDIGLLGLTVEPNRIDEEEEGTYTFYDLGPYSVCEAITDCKDMVSIIRYR